MLISVKKLVRAREVELSKYTNRNRPSVIKKSITTAELL